VPVLHTVGRMIALTSGKYPQVLSDTLFFGDTQVRSPAVFVNNTNESGGVGRD
jgi:hypothetical protein